MNYSLILCEGETDRDLIGCYMESVYNWKFCQIHSNNLFPNEKINWYRDNDNNIKGIWSVGGNSFSESVKKIIAREKYEHRIDKVAIITDHDDVEEAEINRLDDIKKAISSVCEKKIDEINLSKNQWEKNVLINDFSEAEIELLYLLVPFDEIGALETFMLNVIAEQSDDKEYVITKAKEFVNNFESSTYLTKRREKIKAELGVSLSVFSPDRILTTMKELIDSVRWSDFSISHEQFKLLNQC